MLLRPRLPGCVGLRRPRAGERAGVHRHPRDHGRPRRVPRRQQLILGPLLEQVVDHLLRLHEPVAGEPHALVWLEVADRHPDPVDLALVAQVVQDLEPVERREPVLQPAVELHEVDTLDAQAAERVLRPPAQVPARVPAPHCRIGLRRARPGDRLDLGGHVDLAAPPLAERPADDLLAVAGPVHLRGVDEVDALLERVEQGVHGGVVVHGPPLPADLPGPEPDLADLPAGPAERPVLHDPSLLRPPTRR